MDDIKTILNRFTTEFNPFIEQLFAIPNAPEAKAMEAARYSVINGGKRLRPFLIFESARLFDNFHPKNAFYVGAALEMLHTYSLIHDDLPAMDNDTLRRGKPTCHVQFDEATAILAGDGLLTEAFRVLSSPQTSEDTAICCELVNLLATRAGFQNGMIAGQILDLYAENNAHTYDAEKLIKRIEEMKTGCLIQFACEAGAILGQATPIQRQALITYSRKIGIAFQIADDILDVEGTPELMGKTLNKDNAQGKLTFVSLYGLEKSKKLAQELIDEAKQSLDIFGPKAEILKQLADYIISRNT